MGTGKDRQGQRETDGDRVRQTVTERDRWGQRETDGARRGQTETDRDINRQSKNELNSQIKKYLHWKKWLLTCTGGMYLCIIVRIVGDAIISLLICL